MVLLILAVGATAESIDLDDLTPEQLDELRQQLSEMDEQETSGALTSLDMLQAMIDAGAPIDPEKLTDFDETTDVNGLLGTPGSYTSKTDFGCIGYAKDTEGYWVGGTLEVFDNDTDATSRFEYLKAIYESAPILLDCRVYMRSNAVLRISDTIEDAETLSILHAFETTVSGETSSFNGLPESSDSDASASSDVDNAKAASVEDSEIVHTAAEYTQLQNGSKGPDVALMQSRLKELGYLNDVADGIFGSNTKNAVSAFQEANGLEITGIASPSDQAVLFNAGVISANGSEFAAYDPFPVCPAEISRVDLKSSYGMPYVTYTITNVSSGTIQAVTCEIRFFDAFGDRLVGYGEGAFEKNYSVDLSTGESASISTIDDYGMFDYEDAAYVSVAVTRVLMSDGTDLNYNDPVWFEGD